MPSRFCPGMLGGRSRAAAISASERASCGIAGVASRASATGSVRAKVRSRAIVVSLAMSARGPAAVYEEVRAGHESRLLGAQVSHQRPDLFRVAPAPDRKAGEEGRVRL